MSDCPGYLSITISDRIEREELFKYDTLVPCPPVFNFTFFIPTLSLKQSKTYDVELNDAKSVYRVFLTYFWSETTAPGYYSDRSIYALVDSHLNQEIEMYVTLSIFFIALFISVVLTSVYISMLASQRGAVGLGLRAVVPNTDVYMDLKLSDEKSLHEAALDENTSKHSSLDSCRKSQGNIRRSLLVIYVTFKVVYSLAFTFTSALTLVTFSLGVDNDTLTALEDTQGRYTLLISDMQRGRLDGPERYFEAEMERRFSLESGMSTACNRYIDDVKRSILTDIERDGNPDSLSSFIRGDQSMLFILTAAVNRTLGQYRERLAAFRRKYNTDVERRIGRIITQYRSFARQIYWNDWFFYAQGLFNDTDQEWTSRNVVHSDVWDELDDRLLGPDIDFSYFLRVKQMHDVQLWQAEYQQR